jgi:hypothetical protein
MRLVACTLALLTLSAAPALASSDAAWKDLRDRSDRACVKAAGELRNTRITAYADTFQAVTVSTVEGVYRPKHMKGARGKATCVFNKRTSQVEVQELQPRR